jgi:predicted nuclease of predicted toxin-antitoxin system
VAPKLLLDEHLSPTVAHRLTALHFDVTCVRDRGLSGLKDWQLMEWCAGEGRAICTENERDFRKEHQRYLAEGRDHFGIIIVDEWPTERLCRVLAAFLERTGDIDLLNQLISLDEP